MKFTELNLDDSLLEAISYMGFENATPIQAQAIPIILDNKDILACAQTGTGKTGAFVLPILNKLVGKEDTSVNTLIIVPTRELAIQIEQQIQGLSYFVSVGSKAVYGGGTGKDFQEEKDALTKGCDIIVATPGKLLSHLKMGYVKFDKVQHLVMDEADRMLDMGFIDDLKKIISYLPKKHQTLLFSATMPPNIRSLAKSICHNPEEISLSISKPAAGVKQQIFMAFDNQKSKLIAHILKERKEYDSIIIFSSTKAKVSDIVRDLGRAGFPAKGISSNLEQDKREEVLRGFRSKRIRILVATDVMSRGIDIKEINMVINYDVPNDAEDYVHRVGRTARANTKGEAITLVNPKDMHKFARIEKLIERDFEKTQPPKELGDGPEWVAPKKGKGGGKRNFSKGGNNKSKGGKKPFKKKWNNKKGGRDNSSKPKQ
ncbi:MAG: DEAD/DEAH box helicase [Crocinitomicaceae bacterium]